MNSKSIGKALYKSLFGTIPAMVLSLSCLAGPATFSLNIKSQQVGTALMELGESAGVQIIFPQDIGESVAAPGLKGEYTVGAALDALLKDSGLVYEFVSEDSVLVKRAGVSSVERASTKEKAKPKVINKVINEIVVTAQKREKNIQDVPISITAIDSEQIGKKGLIGMNDYLRTLPGISMIDRGAGRNGVFMRGITTDPQNEGFFNGPTVGIYMGETPLTVRGIFGVSDIKMIDMERVEVLRGPQGSLYGASSLGGTIRNIPNAPNLSEFEGRFTAGYSYTAGKGGDNNKVEMVVNIPIVSDKFAVRLVGYRHDNSGYIDNLASSDPASAATATLFGAENLAIDENGVGGDTYKGGRFTALWQPTENFSTTFTYMSQQLEQDRLNEEELGVGKFEQTRYRLGDIIGGGERLNSEIDLASLEFEYDFGWSSLLSSSSWFDQKSDRIRDLGIFFGGAPIPQSNRWDTEVFAEELRLTSNLDGPFQFVVGYFYSDSDVFSKVDIFWGGDDASQNFLDPGNFVLLDGIDPSKVKQTAFFGELSYAINDKLTLTIGGRAFDYETEDRSVWQPSFFSGGVLYKSSAKGKDNGTTYKANLSYTLNDDTLLYLNWAEGFRLGKAFPQPSASSCDTNNDGILDGTNAPINANQVGPDRLENFELGGKFELLENRIVINSAIYRNNWEDIPVSAIGTCALSVIVNAGKARTQGFEVESIFHVTPTLKISMGASYIDAELTEDAPSLGGSNGDRLPGSPDKTLNLAVEYTFEIANHPAYLLTDYARVSEFYNNFQEAGVKAGDYSQVNVRIGVTIDQFEIEGFINNLTDSDELSWVDNIIPGYASRLRPRTAGFQLSYIF